MLFVACWMLFDEYCLLMLRVVRCLLFDVWRSVFVAGRLAFAVCCVFDVCWQWVSLVVG